MSSQWNQIATLLGPAGFSTQSGSGRPASSLGNIGDIYVDTLNAVLYASKTSAGWPSSGRTLVGPVTQTQLPSDITANSLALAAVSGDARGVGMSIANATGTVFNVDGNGNLSAQASTVASLASTGLVSGSTFVSAVGALNNPAFSFNTQIDTGIYLPTTSTTAAVMALVVNATTALTLSKNGVSIPGTLSVPGSINVGTLNATSVNNTGGASAAGYLSSLAGAASAPSFSYTAQTDTGLYLAATSGTAAVLALAVNGVQALALSKGGVTVPGTLAAQGASTLAGVTLSTLSASGAGTFSGLLKAPSLMLTGMGGQITFPDGTTQGTAASTPNVGSSPTFSATSVGSTTAPSFLFSAQTDSGLYLATTSTSAAVLAFTVNNTQSLAMAASGVTVPGTLTVNGASAFSGSATFASVNMSNLTLSGNLTVNGNSALQALTVTSLSNSGTTTSAGHTVSANGSAAVPSYSFIAQPDTGMYLPTASTSAAVLGFSANGTLALNVFKGGITVPGTLGVTGASTLEAVSASSLAVSGNETIAGTSSITGLLTASGNITTPVLTTTQAPTVKTVSSTSYTVSNISLPGTFGDGASYPPSGISSDSLGNLLLNYMGVPFIRSSNNGYSSSAANSPGSPFVTSFLSGSYVFNGGGNTLLALSSTSAKYGFTANTVPFTMQALSGNILVLQNGGSAPNYTTQTVATVSSAGLATFVALTMTGSTGLTFGDNSVQTTAYTSNSASNQQRYYANSNGTTALPSLTFSANTDTGAYLKTASTSAAVLGLSVNATDAMTLSKTGVSVPGTLSVTGNATLAGTTSLSSLTTSASATLASLSVSGASTVAALTASGLVTAANVTLSSSGKLTFADGTSQTTAYSTSGAAQSTYSTSSNGTVSVPAYTFANQADSGMYLATASTTAAVVAFAVNATQAFSFTKTLATFNQLTTTGALTSNTTATAANFVATAANGGSTSAPAITSTQSSTSGINFSNTSLSIIAGGTAIFNVSPTQVNTNSAATFVTQGPVIFNGNVTFNGGALSFGNSAITTGGTVTGNFVAAQTNGGTVSAPAYHFGNNSNTSGFYWPNSTTGIACTSSGTLVWNASSTLMTLSVPITTPKTITSTTAAGTASFVSSQGFKFVQQMMYWNKSYSANALWTCYDVQVTNDGATTNPADFRFVFPFAGSVTALTLAAGGTTSGTNNVYIYRNGSSIYQWSPGSGQNTSTPWYASFAKGTYAFAVGDVLTIQVSNSGSGEIRHQVRAFIEVGA